MQHSEACEKPLVGSAFGTGGFHDACVEKQMVLGAHSGVSSAPDSKTPSHAKKQSAACEKPQGNRTPKNIGTCGGLVSQNMTPSHPRQYSDALRQAFRG
mmetsp:Transcript_174360/g.553469  ORF Transcript_174360/g.553469 Transcript_174360/m.553469 type:complete len:99 (-) Transcript_174360:63-359(-)